MADIGMADIGMAMIGYEGVEYGILDDVKDVSSKARLYAIADISEGFQIVGCSHCSMNEASEEDLVLGDRTPLGGNEIFIGSSLSKIDHDSVDSELVLLKEGSSQVFIGCCK